MNVESRTAEDPDTGHDYDGIREYDNALPRWWLWTFAITVVFALAYWFVEHSLPSATSTFDDYGEDQHAYDVAALSSAVDPAVVEAKSKDPAVLAVGKTHYDNRCVGCHGPRAEGMPGGGPNLTDKYWIHGGDTKSIYMTIAGGYPKLGMPEWRLVLEDADLQAVVAFLLSVRNTDVPGRAPQGELWAGEGK